METSIDFVVLFLLFDYLSLLLPEDLSKDFLRVDLVRSFVFFIEETLVFWSLTSLTVLPFVVLILLCGFKDVEGTTKVLPFLLSFKDLSLLPEFYRLILRKSFREVLLGWLILLILGDGDRSRPISLVLFNRVLKGFMVLSLMFSLVVFWLWVPLLVDL